MNVSEENGNAISINVKKLRSLVFLYASELFFSWKMNSQPEPKN